MTVWLERRVVIAIHEIQLAEPWGGVGLRDPGLVNSTLARPVNQTGDGEPDVAELGSHYALGIIRNHPFIDGGKRTGFSTLFAFLSFNGMECDPPEAEATMTILSPAAGKLSDDDFISWVRHSIRPKP